MLQPSDTYDSRLEIFTNICSREKRNRCNNVILFVSAKLLGHKLKYNKNKAVDGVWSGERTDPVYTCEKMEDSGTCLGGGGHYIPNLQHCSVRPSQVITSPL